MDLNPHLLQRLTAIQQTLMAQHAGGINLPNATIGNERETFLREFLQKLFPAHRRFSTGAITDSKNQISGQVDIAVEFGFIPSFPMPTTNDRLLLAESVAMVIEVKSDLSAQWNQVESTIRQVKILQRKMNLQMTMGILDPESIPCIAVGYRGHTTINGLTDRLNNTPETQRPDAALVIESGCFSGFGYEADGPLGLYALCIVINNVLSEICFATPNLMDYVHVHGHT